MQKKKSLTVDEVKRLAKLANLSLTQEEIDTFSKQLSSVVGYISKLNEVNANNVEEISQVTGLENVEREDKVDTSRTLKVDEALKNAASTRDNMFKVKAIFKE